MYHKAENISVKLYHNALHAFMDKVSYLSSMVGLLL